MRSPEGSRVSPPLPEHPEVNEEPSEPASDQESARAEPRDDGTLDDRPRTPVPPGLQHLFGVEGRTTGDRAEETAGSPQAADTSGPASGGTAAASGTTQQIGTGDAVGQSRHLQAYEEEAGGSVLPLGLQPLDDVLGGGLDRGVMVVGGDPGSGKTLLLEEAARSALARGWWVYYAAYREGTLRAWERLMARESLEDEGLPLPFSAVRGRTLDAASQERLRALDARFRQQTAPRLVLVDRLPGGRDGLRALLDNIWWRLREAREAGGRGPLVLVDDLQTLERLIRESEDNRRSSGAAGAATTAAGPVGLGELVSRLDRELLRLGLPALVSVASSAPSDLGLGQAPASVEPGLLASFFLRLTCGSVEGGSEVPLEVALEKNGRTGWLGRFHLTLDRRVGRFGSIE